MHAQSESSDSAEFDMSLQWVGKQVWLAWAEARADISVFVLD